MAKKIKVRSDVPKEPALIIENQLLLKPGVWKNIPLTAEEIKKGLLYNTDWEDKRNSSIYYGHDPKKTENWVGLYDNRRYLTLQDGVDVEGFYGDLKIYDTNLASKLAYGGAKMAVSQGMDYAWGNNGPTDLKFNHLGIVHDPGCRDERLFLNLDNEEEFVEGKRYTGEARHELNLDSDLKEENQTDIKEEKNMTDKEITSSADIDENVLKEVVDKILSQKEEAEKVLAEKRASDEEKRIAEEKRIKDEAIQAAQEATKKIVEEIKPVSNTEEIKSLQQKLEEISQAIIELKKPAVPVTTAQPSSNVNNIHGRNQSEIAEQIIKSLSK